MLFHPWRLIPATTSTTYTDKSLTVAETTRQYRVSSIIIAANGRPAHQRSLETVAIATTAKATVPGKPSAPTLDPMGPTRRIDTAEWTAPTRRNGRRRSQCTGLPWIERSDEREYVSLRRSSTLVADMLKFKIDPDY